MGDILKPEELRDSFFAVNSFLRNGNLSAVDHLYDVRLKVNAQRQNFNGTFEIECKDFLQNESYVIYSNVFKANGFHRPVWSSYVYMTFDEGTGELEFELDGIKYILKH